MSTYTLEKGYQGVCPSLCAVATKEQVYIYTETIRVVGIHARIIKPFPLGRAQEASKLHFLCLLRFCSQSHRFHTSVSGCFDSKFERDSPAVIMSSLYGRLPTAPCVQPCWLWLCLPGWESHAVMGKWFHVFLHMSRWCLSDVFPFVEHQDWACEIDLARYNISHQSSPTLLNDSSLESRTPYASVVVMLSSSVSIRCQVTYKIFNPRLLSSEMECCLTSHSCLYRLSGSLFHQTQRRLLP